VAVEPDTCVKARASSEIAWRENRLDQPILVNAEWIHTLAPILGADLGRKHLGGKVNETFSKPKTGALLGLVTAAAVLSAGASQATITYHVDQTFGGGSVVGTIQTDGATGILAASDVTGWNLKLNGIGATDTLTDADSVVFVAGSDVTATASDLFFNYSGGDNGVFLFQRGLFSGTHYYCNATQDGDCFQGKSVVPQSIFDSTAVHVPAADNQIIGVAGVPEPASWAMMLLGFGGLGAAMRARRQSRAAAATA
jgi:hypothetical protein